MLARYILAELLKLRRSLALLLCLAAPTCVALLTTMMALDLQLPPSMRDFGRIGAAFWAFAMLPLSVTALSVLLAQSEHGTRSWDHLLTFPGARRDVPLAKAAVTVALVLAMSALLLAELAAGAALFRALHPEAARGSFGAAALGDLLLRMAGASLLAIAVQLWVALRFKSFVPPLLVGIGGTFIAVGATSAKQGVYFPWLMAFNMLAPDPVRHQVSLAIGLVGGAVALAAMVVHLSRREA